MNEDPVIGPVPAKNVSPTYGVYDKISSQQAIEERREQRRNGADPTAQLRSQLETLRRNQDNDQKKIADLEEFRRGMSGDENIRVSDNKITWVGRGGEGNINGFTPVELDVAVNGEHKVSTFLYDGFR